MKNDTPQPPYHGYRKPYQPPMNKSWWRQLPYYIFYIMRESTAFFMLWISIILTFGIICAYPNAQGVNEFYRFIFFLQNPIVVVINILALVAALFHTLTWFNLMPKAVNIVIAAKKPPAALFIIGLWVIMMVVSSVILYAVFGYFR